MEFIELEVPEDFSFIQCMVYLNRSDNECLHSIKNDEFYKLLSIDNNRILIKLSMGQKNLKINFLNLIPNENLKFKIIKYIVDMFDLETDLTQFYKLAEKDPIIEALVSRYKGLRIVKMNDMFETICWAIIGQQINLKFAYILKRRLVEAYGDNLIFENEKYFVFPTPGIISKLEISDLKELQFTTRKAEYIIAIANLFSTGIIKQDEFASIEYYKELKQKLIAIRGIGNWTADYTIMKCFNLNNAFPIADVGIHNALKNILGLNRKPTILEIEELSKSWNGWQAYVTFYLWRSLYAN